MAATIVSGREHGEKLATGESFEAIHYALVRSQYKPNFIILKEEFDTVRSELHDVARTVRVSDEVWLNSKFLITVSRVRPQNVNYKLLLQRRDLVNNLKWSLNSLNLVQTHKSAANSTVQAHDLVFNDGGKGQPIEHVIDLTED